MTNEFPSFLSHYGRSIKDGAPGVGTGNWRRSGGSSDYKSKEDFKVHFTKKQQKSIEKNHLQVSNYTYDPSGNFDDDIKIKKGTSYQRVTIGQGKGTDYQNKRKYVSFEPENYTDEFFSDKELKRAFVETYTTKKNSTIAGRKAIDRILKELGEKPIEKYYHDQKKNDKEVEAVWKKQRTPVDFINADEKLGRKFIDRAVKEGYSGMIDPFDTQASFSNSATIFFSDTLDKVGSIPLSEFEKNKAA